MNIKKAIKNKQVLIKKNRLFVTLTHTNTGWKNVMTHSEYNDAIRCST